MLQVGYILGNRYEILEHIGTGGMSDVYKAWDSASERYVAIKVLRRENYEDETLVKRFMTEAEATAMLDHPNIVGIYDAAFTDGVHYIVMELAEGMTLKRYIRRYSRLSAKETVDIAMQIAKGLEAAHEKNIVHRDIKPQNILVSDSGKVKITDFGIAKAATGDTISSNTMGSVHYLSPEQAKGGYVDKRSDIYSLGITMYEMAVGKVPFDGDNNVAIALMHIKNEITPPRQYYPDIPESLQRIILKCTAKKPLHRYQSARELILDLQKVFISQDGNYVFIADSEQDGSPTIKRDMKEIETIKQSLRQNRTEDGEDPSQIPDNRDYEDNDIEENGEDDSEDKPFTNVIRIFMILMGVLLAGVLLYAIGSALSGINVGKPGDDETEKIIEATTGNVEVIDEDLVEVPNVMNMTRKKARNTLKKQGFKVEFQYGKYYSDKDNGLVVVAQNPEAGEEVQKESVVTLTLGVDEASYVEIPDLLGLKEKKAEKKLKDLGLKVNLAYATSDTIEAGYVMAQNPVGGAKVAKGFAVTITVSKGLEEVRVPSLYGMSQTAAQRQLESVGLELGDVSSDYSGDVGVNDVIDQSVDAGTYVEKGTKVSIVISLGEPTRIRYEGKLTITDSPFEGDESGMVELVLSQSGKETVIYTERRLSADDFPLSLTFEGQESGSGIVIMRIDGKDVKEYEVQVEAIAG